MIEGDALDDRSDASPPIRGRSFRIVSNLPYNVGTALLTRWIEAPAWPPRWDRHGADVSARGRGAHRGAAVDERADYGRLGVLCGWRTEARILFDVPPVRLHAAAEGHVRRGRTRSAARTPALFGSATSASMTQAAFGQRRKMLRQSLKSLPALGVPPSLRQRFSKRPGSTPTLRAEEVDVAGFVRLTNTLARPRRRSPTIDQASLEQLIHEGARRPLPGGSGAGARPRGSRACRRTSSAGRR